MLKNLLYVFLYILPLASFSMEESWKPVEGTNLFKSVRAIIAQEKSIPSSKLDTRLQEIESEFFVQHKEHMGTYKHYSGLEKALAELSNAANYKMAITTAVAQYYWGQYGTQLAQEGFKAVREAINKENVMLIMDKSQTAVDWLVQAGIAVGKVAQKTIAGQMFQPKNKDDLSASVSSFEMIENTGFIPSINALSKNDLRVSAYSCITMEEKSAFANISGDGNKKEVLYVLDPSIMGHVKADKVFFIVGNGKDNNGINDLETLKNFNLLDKNVDEESFIDGSSLKSPIEAATVYFLMNNLAKSGGNVRSVSNHFPQLKKIEVMAKEIVINDELARRMVTNNLQIKNIRDRTTTNIALQYANIKTLTYAPIPNDWVEMTPEIAAENEGYTRLTKSIAKQHGKETRERQQQLVEKQKLVSITVSSSQVHLSTEEDTEVSDLKKHIKDLSEGSYNRVDQKFFWERNYALFALSEKINNIADDKIKNDEFAQKDYVIFETMGFDTFIKDSSYLVIIKFSGIKMTDDETKDFFLIAPKEIIKYFDPLMVTQAKLRYTYTTISGFYEMSALNKQLHDIFDNKVNPIEQDFEFKKSNEEAQQQKRLDFWTVPEELRSSLNPKIELLTADDNAKKLKAEWDEGIHDVINNPAYKDVKERREAFEAYVNSFIQKWKQSIRYTLSEIGKLEKYTKSEGSLLIVLSSFITTIKNHSENKDSIKNFINNILPSNEYNHQEKFGLILTNDNVFFLVPMPLIESVKNRNNNTEKNLIQSDVEFEWTRVYRIYANAETLRSALNQCYETNSPDLRSALKSVEDSQKRWYKPWTWNWSGGYYFKKETFQRDYPERAEADAVQHAAEKEFSNED
jgi:hypothetical protein